MRSAAPLMLLLLVPPLAPVGAADPPAPPPALQLSHFVVQYALAPHDGSGQNVGPYTFHTYVFVDVHNPLAENVTGVTATVYSGAGAPGTTAAVTASFTVTFDRVDAGTTRTFFFDKNSLPMPYWCITLGPKQSLPPVYLDDVPPYTGFDTTECDVPDNPAVPPPGTLA